VAFETAQADEFDEVVGSLDHRRLVKAALQLHTVSDITGDRAPGQQAGVLENDRPIDARAVHPFAVDYDRALIKRQQTSHDV